MFLLVRSLSLSLLAIPLWNERDHVRDKPTTSPMRYRLRFHLCDDFTGRRSILNYLFCRRGDDEPDKFIRICGPSDA
jgi:hypothetical protein